MKKMLILTLCLLSFTTYQAIAKTGRKSDKKSSAVSARKVNKSVVTDTAAASVADTSQTIDAKPSTPTPPTPNNPNTHRPNPETDNPNPTGQTIPPVSKPVPPPATGATGTAGKETSGGQ